MKPHIPDAALEWVEKFLPEEFEKVISCPGCGYEVEIGDRRIEWALDTPSGRESFIAGSLAVYDCARCQKIYFPPNVFDAVTDCFAKEALEHYKSFQVQFEKPENWERLSS